MRKWLILVFFLVCPNIVLASVLSDAASSLAVQSFVRIDPSMGGWNGGTVLLPAGCTGGDVITQYANTAVWNTQQKRFQFSGSPHNACSGTNEKAIYYDDAANMWGALPTPPSSGNDPRHSYGHNAIDPQTGEHYYTHYNSLGLFRLNAAGTVWTTLTSRTGNVQCCRGQAYFPDVNGLMHVDGDWGVRLWKKVTNTWQQLSQGNGSDGSGLPQFTGAAYPAWALYSHRCRCVIWGNGSNFRKLNSDLTFTALSTTGWPGPINIGPTNMSVVVDPASGFLLVISGSTMYQFDPGVNASQTGTWSTVSATIPTFFTTGGSTSESLISAPISTYGVIMYVKHNDSSEGQVWLYKHTASTAADLDFFRRRESSGVFRWFDFDTPGDYADYAPGAGNNHCWGCNFGIGPNGTAPNIATPDTTVKASGVAALKFIQPQGGGAAAAGNWFTNLTPDKSYALANTGDDVYIQYRLRLSPEYFNGTNWPGATQYKTSDFSAGDTASCTTSNPTTATCPGSCTEVEIVQTASFGRQFPETYAGCSGPEAFQGFYKHTSGQTDFHPNWTGTPTRSCLYPGPYGEPNCFTYVPNEWLTLQFYVQLGTWKTYSSTYKMWLAREGQPSQLIMDCGPGKSCGTKSGGDTTTGLYFHNDSTNSLTLGKLWLLPYQTSLTAGAVDASMWFDELIISRQQIPDPGVASVNPPTNLRIP